MKKGRRVLDEEYRMLTSVHPYNLNTQKPAHITAKTSGNYAEYTCIG